jgi:hypothetical protein
MKAIFKIKEHVSLSLADKPEAGAESYLFKNPSTLF